MKNIHDFKAFNLTCMITMWQESTNEHQLTLISENQIFHLLFALDVIRGDCPNGGASLFVSFSLQENAPRRRFCSVPIVRGTKVRGNRFDR